jgi:predicted DNA-binding transcriptional regulator YafY
MRADRLLSLLMILQARGRVTAEALAEELEVSIRTVYRDLDALSAAGVPVYAERGPGGGCALLDSYRTSLTGLTDAEVRALFVTTLPAALVQLGMGAELKAALLKLSAALPAERRQDEAWIRQRIHLDWSGDAQGHEPVPQLPLLKQAVWENRRLWLAHRLPSSPGLITLERLVDPLGLVTLAGDWHLVCSAGGRLRVYRVASLLDARITGESFERPAGFDLAALWAGWRAERESRRARYAVTVRVSPEIAPWLPQLLGTPVQAQIDAAPRDKAARDEPARDEAARDPAGWITLTLSFDSLETARSRLLGLGAAVEVLAPLPLRLSLADYAAQVVALYGGAPGAFSAQ